MGSLQYLVFVAIAFGLGTLISIYTPMISSTSAFMGSPLAGSVVFFAIALAASILMLILVGDVRTISKYHDDAGHKHTRWPSQRCGDFWR